MARGRANTTALARLSRGTAVVFALLLGACGTPDAGQQGELTVALVGAGNGYVNVETSAGARCIGANVVTRGSLAAPLAEQTAVADRHGRVSFGHPALAPDQDIDLEYRVTCSLGSATAFAARTVSISPAPTATAVATVRVTESRYGAVAAETRAASACSLEVLVPASDRGTRPPRLISATADAGGVVRWSYPAPRGAAGTGEHRVTCTTGGGVARGVERFEVPGPQIDARRFTARVIAAGISAKDQDLGREVPSLVPLRDATVAAAIRSLPSEWRAATRGLSELTVVEHSEDILVSVVAGSGTSVFVRSPLDQTQEVFVFVEGKIGPNTTENGVAVILHELGHIWCCRGPGTVDGHWAEQQVSPGLGGLDKYGLMNHPVMCSPVAGFMSCPNRFSDRELTAMGFRDLPPPPVDPCVSRKSALQVEIPRVRASAAALEPQIQADTRTLDALRAEIGAIERQYSGGVPSHIYGNYSAMIERHNALLAEHRARIAEYNALISRGNALAQESNALPCTL